MHLRKTAQDFSTFLAVVVVLFQTGTAHEARGKRLHVVKAKKNAVVSYFRVVKNLSKSKKNSSCENKRNLL